jgi:uncharacterized membrane protein (UPF0127 family)
MKTNMNFRVEELMLVNQKFSLIQKAIIAILVLVLCLAVLHGANSMQVKFALVPMQVGHQIITVQLADTNDKRLQGLMGQETLENGLVLVYDKPWRIKLWMKNTPSALDVAFIDEDWMISQINQMEPFSLVVHESLKPSIAALEMPLGWFKANQIELGTRVHMCHKENEYCTKKAIR